MFKLIVAVSLLVAIASAMPSDMSPSDELQVPSEKVEVQVDATAAAAAVAEDGENLEANKEEGLEGSETFGFGYYHHYPRYYYPRYYYGYPRYYGYSYYPRYYW
ncbi:uncharacterized protein LOC129751201 [Uranotaenia lowii]|uniref:uncharacterized protein LOC129751201 n=1 Tax=Uranotaenia lowii TaxID=190385 RepID=UPI00247AF96E|nr:uncharacterized protein LOC129751201 [Uranotaenia lowii]